MTRDEAIEELKEDIALYMPTEWVEEIDRDTPDGRLITALEMAIKALETPPNDNWEGYSYRLWKNAYERGKADAEQTSVLGKIKAKLIEEKECAYADFDKYKVNYLGVDSRYVEDELPYDDFRYGMERCIDIINKYIVESEDNA